MKFKFISLIFSIMILSGCVNNNYCHDVYDSQTLICISGIEILDSSRIRVKKDSENCPIYYTNKNGDNVISNELTVSDVISFSDEHYGVSLPRVTGSDREGGAVSGRINGVTTTPREPM